MVQQASRFRFSDTRGGDARHLRPHGDPAPVRNNRIAPRTIRSGPLRTGTEGLDGRRGASRERSARSFVALIAAFVSLQWFTRPAASLLAALVACLLWVALVPAGAAGEATVEIISKSGVHAFSVELATNDAERERGLMFRKELPEGRGMLFDFEREAPVAFWMHNTYIPLDLIFIRAAGSIPRIAENAEPLSARLIPSGGPVRAVLEVIGGPARKLGIAPGDNVAGAMF